VSEPAAAPATRLEAVVRGRVQGVGFRFWVVRRATGLGLTGWVANEFDGSVRCVAEGSAAALDELEALLRAGPMGAIVEEVRAVRMPAVGAFRGFQVRSGGHRGD
jgi:acylphosphatase